MSIWVAYNDYGDLIAEHCSYWGLVALVEALGYEAEDVYIGRAAA